MNLTKFAKNLYKRIIEDDVTALAAQLSYYLLLSFFPFLIMLFSLISLNQQQAISQEIWDYLASIIPKNSFELLYVNIIQATRNNQLLSFGIITTLWSASRGVGAVSKGLNKAYAQKETRPFWKVEIMAVFFTLCLLVLIIFTFFLLIFGNKIGNFLISALVGSNTMLYIIWDLVRFMLTFFCMTSVFAFFYKYMPNVRVKWHETFAGAIFTSVGWVVTSLGFSFYVDNFGNYSKLYGSIGGIIALLIWLYISSIIILLGGEINALFKERTAQQDNG